MKRKVTIGQKLIGGFLSIALLLALTAGVAYIYFTEVDESYSDLVDRRAVILRHAQSLQVLSVKQSNSLRGYVMTGEKEFAVNLQSYEQQAQEVMKNMEALLQSDENKQVLQEFAKASEDFKKEYTKLLQMIDRQEDSAKVTEYFMQQVLPLGRKLEPVIDQIVTSQLQSMEEGSRANSAAVDTATANLVWFSAGALVLSILIGYFMSRMIAKPIVQVARAAELVAAGDLTQDELRVKNNDEIGEMARSFNHMAANLRNLIQQINIGAENVAASSEELSASAEQTSLASETISSGIQEVVLTAEKQARGAEESVEAMNEMALGIEHIAEQTEMTSSLSRQASQKSEEGNRTIQQAISQMDALDHTIQELAKAVQDMGDHSQQVGKIVEVISGIATQTNLLALNAAIEAARAGEHGRGFAIVADEVRKLAEESARSADQIIQLIGAMQKNTEQTVERMEKGISEVEESIQTVHTAGEQFSEIKSYVEQVSERVQAITAASRQIAASSQHVTASAHMILDGSRTVAASSQNVSAASEEQLSSVEEVTSSAESLAEMAEELRSLVARFRV
ncbi:methyl-accepting chemotaxis protein [Brevibacillus composti]|uniref:Methyl-accepting chemotaxis protein n=1 Tax=Brevibacillus composti TaxID=2796470 RepID=A0A7T5JN15_9BACL|nr:methyl-accepting chemotaxis protein [Brevibacillus composti]QQE73963.1 methyl-accepting chemotaxis protein [Brevibacillus composti]QUO41047.1 methyl-accepting chemotaxis protein [Brevibacillus composti]